MRKGKKEPGRAFRSPNPRTSSIPERATSPWPPIFAGNLQVGFRNFPMGDFGVVSPLLKAAHTQRLTLPQAKR